MGMTMARFGKVYRCPIYMEHAERLIEKWRKSGVLHPRMADELEATLCQDQHDLFHDAEFFDGCDICDQERKEYG